MGRSKKRSTAEVFVENLKYLMRLHDYKQISLAEKAGLSQKTISNILTNRQVPSIETVQRLAEAFSLDGWHMMMPGLPDDLKSSRSIEELYYGYVRSSPEGRRHIEMVAEREAAYTSRQANEK